MGPQRLHIPCAVVRLAERIDQEVDPTQAEALEELPAEGDHLDVEVGVVGTEHLDADLFELAVPATLGLLVAELRARVPHLPRDERAVLHEGPAHRCRELGAQGDVPAPLVDEVVHLLGHHVGRITDALDHPEVFEQRRDDLAVPGTLSDLGEHRHETTPASRLGRQDVAHPGAGLELGHGDRSYPPPLLCQGGL